MLEAEEETAHAAGVGGKTAGAAMEGMRANLQCLNESFFLSFDLFEKWSPLTRCERDEVRKG